MNQIPTTTQREVSAVILSVDGDVRQRKSAGAKFTKDDIEIMVGGEYVATELNINKLVIGAYSISNPCFFCRKDAREIPLLPNIEAMGILKSTGIIDYPLGNVAIINRKKLEHGIK